MKLFNVMVAVSLCVFTVTTASAQNRFLRAERKAPGDTYHCRSRPEFAGCAGTASR